MSRKEYLLRQWRCIGRCSPLVVQTKEEEKIRIEMGAIKSILNGEKDAEALLKKAEKEKDSKKKKDLKDKAKKQRELTLKLKEERGYTEITERIREDLTEKKKLLGKQLDELIRSYGDKPRVLNAKVLCKSKYINLENLDEKYMIQNFESEFSRIAEIETNSFYTDMLIMQGDIGNDNKLVDEEIWRQICTNGIDASWLIDGKIVHKHYVFVFSSAGQLRTTRATFLNEEVWEEVYPHLYAGLSVDEINAKGGFCVNKLFAYWGSAFSASERWKVNDDFFDWRHMIIVKDIETGVKLPMYHIDQNYVETREEDHEEILNQCDGLGWVLPRIAKKSNPSCNSFMIRGPFIKGLLISFDYIAYAKYKNVEPIVVDYWGKEHNLVTEDIWCILTESQLKAIGKFDSLEDFINRCENNNCYICRTNYEEEEIGTSTLCYQFIQTLTDINNDEITRLTKRTYENIKNIGTTVDSMLNVLGATEENKEKTWLQKCLTDYHALLRDGYCIEQIKQIKDSLIRNAQACKFSGDEVQNRRLFVAPDPTAAFDYIFNISKDPEGIIPTGYVCVNERHYNDVDVVDVLRSPHLTMEHCVRKLLRTEEAKRWLTGNICYIPFKDLISRVLQCDYDGDMVNVLKDKTIIAAALRTISNHDIIPSFYDAQKTTKVQINVQSKFEGLQNGFSFGAKAIGAISNGLTILWNQAITDDTFKTSRLMSCKNNYIIDAAKIGKIKDYPPDVAKLIKDKLTTIGSNGKKEKAKKPWAFTFTKNYIKNNDTSTGDKPADGSNQSVWNKIALIFDPLNSDPISFNFTNLDNFNFTMLINGEYNYKPEIVVEFTRLVKNAQNLRHIQKELRQHAYQENEDDEIFYMEKTWWENKYKEIKEELSKLFSNEKEIYDSIVYSLFYEHRKESYYKKFFWEMYGKEAFEALEYNRRNHTECDKPGCNMLVPLWDVNHQFYHQKADEYHKVCAECGEVFKVKAHSPNQKRCVACAKAFKSKYAKEAGKRCNEKMKRERMRRNLQRETGQMSMDLDEAGTLT